MKLGRLQAALPIAGPSAEVHNCDNNQVILDCQIDQPVRKSPNLGAPCGANVAWELTGVLKNSLERFSHFGEKFQSESRLLGLVIHRGFVEFRAGSVVEEVVYF